MAHRLEIALKPELFDAEGHGVLQKAEDYFGIRLDSVRTVSILTMDVELTPTQLEIVRDGVFTNPVTQMSGYAPIALPFDWMIWVGLKPGVRDNAGSTAVEAVEDMLGIRLKPGEAIYTSKRFCLCGASLDRADVDRIAGQLLANDLIQQWRIYGEEDWDTDAGVGDIIPKVTLNHTPTLSTISIDSDEVLRAISDQRNLALNPADIPTIRSYFLREDVLAARRSAGLSEPTDVELEYISQARSDHCNHNTFKGKFRYTDHTTGKTETVDNLFETYIETPTKALKEKKKWVVSVLWDNAGAGRFDDDHHYVITGETHNSPSNMEAYGGAITGIVGIYRDPMGTGKGARLVMGSYGFCVGPRNYDGPLTPRLHPRRLLDGVIEGVRDGGNKSGIPTTFGQVYFDEGYLGKCLVFVTAVGIMPATVAGAPSEEKDIRPGDRVIMCGGRVGKDGIHGVTASSEVFSENTPAGHVQIGDPYTQKKMHDFLLDARDEGLIEFITDNGGGGLSSSVGESARFSNGCHIELEKVPLKYEGLDQWEIWVSESQERMTVAVAPGNVDRFMDLSRRHAVESTVIGTYTDTGKLHITYDGKTCAFVDLDLPSAGFPQWKFDAEWTSPGQRGMVEPVLGDPVDWPGLITDMMARPNICSKEWIVRQYDHEVQGGSVVKPLVGVDRDVASDGAVIRPVLGSRRGLAFAQALLPGYSRIDAYHMTTCAIDEAVRRVIAVGGDPSHIGGVDNFCWPSIRFDAANNPDGKFKAAQLVRACRALKDMCEAYDIPLLSGKDSMYVDGHLPGKYGLTHKVSALESLQFSTISVVDDINRCATMDVKAPGDRVYVLGETRNELGGSEYYALLGYVGRNVPKVDPARTLPLYRALSQAIGHEYTASVHGVYQGGLGVHLALCAAGGGLGMTVDMRRCALSDVGRDDCALFSETPGRFVVTVAPAHQEAFERLFEGLACHCVGTVESTPVLRITGLAGNEIVDMPVSVLKQAWQQPFGDFI